MVGGLKPAQLEVFQNQLQRTDVLLSFVVQVQVEFGYLHHVSHAMMIGHEGQVTDEGQLIRSGTRNGETIGLADVTHEGLIAVCKRNVFSLLNSTLAKKASLIFANAVLDFFFLFFSFFWHCVQSIINLSVDSVSLGLCDREQTRFSPRVGSFGSLFANTVAQLLHEGEPTLVWGKMGQCLRAFSPCRGPAAAADGGEQVWFVNVCELESQAEERRGEQGFFDKDRIEP